MKFFETRLAFVCPLFLILSLGTSRETRPGDDGFALRSLLPPGGQHAALRRAVLGARRQLARPECQQVFSEFKDASGRTLQENLDAQGQTAASYLGLILFADGARRVVYVCGRQFAFEESISATRAEAFLIHEELHSLGLGENPPSKFVNITRAQGLFDDRVFQILEDDDGNFWMSCNKGIFRVVKKDLDDLADGRRSSVASVAYGQGDGMPVVECNGQGQPVGWKAKDGCCGSPPRGERCA